MKVGIHPEALTEFEEAAAYYVVQHPGFLACYHRGFPSTFNLKKYSGP